MSLRRATSERRGPLWHHASYGNENERLTIIARSEAGPEIGRRAFVVLDRRRSASDSECRAVRDEPFQVVSRLGGGRADFSSDQGHKQSDFTCLTRVNMPEELNGSSERL